MADTRIITTPVTGTEVEIKTWISGGDDEAIQAVLEDSLSVSADQGGGSANISGSVVRAMRHKALEIVVKRVGDDTNVVEALLKLPRQDYKFVCQEVDAVTEGTSEAKKA